MSHGSRLKKLSRNKKIYNASESYFHTKNYLHFFSPENNLSLYDIKYAQCREYSNTDI